MSNCGLDGALRGSPALADEPAGFRIARRVVLENVEGWEIQRYAFVPASVSCVSHGLQIHYDAQAAVTKIIHNYGKFPVS
jgi:hypothetical protein